MPTVTTNDIETYYERRGDGPPVVFIHGAILDHAQWDPQLEALSDEYTTIAYDVRGHGRTGGSAVEAYSMDRFASDLDQLITGLDLEKPVLCGLSTGGCIAQVYAARYPDRISGLVLADTFTPEILDRQEWFQRSVMLRAVIPPVQLIGFERVEKAMLWLQERISGNGASGDYEKVKQLRADAPKMSTAEFTKVLRAVSAFEDADVDYEQIPVPTLVIYGENELPFVRQHAAKLGSVLAEVSIERVSDAGHASNLDNPEFFSGALREFLESLERSHETDAEASGEATAD